MMTMIHLVDTFLTRLAAYLKKIIAFTEFDLKFTVKEVQNKRIKKVIIEKLNSASDN